LRGFGRSEEIEKLQNIEKKEESDWLTSSSPTSRPKLIPPLTNNRSTT
jgi:hypothetical protein